jgi:hypothetical protein
MKLIVILGLTVLVSAIARLLGTSRIVSVLFAAIPAAFMEALFFTSGVIVRTPDGEAVPVWQMMAGGMVIPVALATVVAILVRKRGPNQSVQPTPGSVTPRASSSTSK